MSGVTLFAPSAAIPRHFHNCDEVVYLLEGHGIAEIEGEEHLVAKGDVSFIPEGITHCFRNASATEQMKIYWTYASLDATRTILATGVTTRIEDELRLGKGPVGS